MPTTTLHEYIRTTKPTKDHLGRRLSKNAPKGVVVVERQGNSLVYGWSLCNLSHDAFDKEVGLTQAKARMGERINLNTVPHSVRKALMKLDIRARRYFQGKKA